MHVDVNFFVRNLQEKQRDRMRARRQQAAVAFGERAPDQTVTHKTPVDKKILRVARSAALAWRRDEADHARGGGLLVRRIGDERQ